MKHIPRDMTCDVLDPNMVDSSHLQLILDIMEAEAMVWVHNRVNTTRKMVGWSWLGWGRDSMIEKRYEFGKELIEFSLLEYTECMFLLYRDGQLSPQKAISNLR